MEILLDGINLKDRAKLNSIIINMVKDVFGEVSPNVKEIIIPADFRKVVNSKHRRTFPDQEYISHNNKTTLAKNFRVNNYCEIVLNNQLYVNDEELFFSTLYHEVVHAKFYHDISNAYYSKINIEDLEATDTIEEYVDKILEIFTLRVIDEYNAYKKTFEKYPNIGKRKNYLFYSERLIQSILLLENDSVEWFDDCKDYMNKITTCLSIVFALWAVHKNDGNDKIINIDLLQDSDKVFLRELYDLLNSAENGIPQDKEFIDIKKYIKVILEWVNWG